MSLAVEMPSDITSSPSSSSSAFIGAQPAGDSPRPRPSTPSRIIQNIMGGRSLSPFRTSSSSSGSGFLSRATSLRSSSSSDSMKKKTKATTEGIKRENSPSSNVLGLHTQPAAIVTSSSNLAAPIAYSSATAAPSHRSPEKGEKKRPVSMISLSTTTSVTPQKSPLSANESPRVVIQPPPPSEGCPEPQPTPVEDIDEEIISTRSASPLEDLTDSQVTASSEATIWEDLPESLRLMRVAQRHGIKVVDFAFEGPKREGVIEDWAWEGGAACKGFGVGIGGGAYNGALKKYQPPSREVPEEAVVEDDRMEIDRPPVQNIFSPRPQSVIGSLAGRTSERMGPSLQSPSAGRTTFGSAATTANNRATNGNGAGGALSTSGFLQYLQDRKKEYGLPFATDRSDSAAGVKRDRSITSLEPKLEDCSPFKKRFIG
ncbi:hypothetical protein FRC20_003717 [Serendipita sp. 405]|nr:hypothetical protein FRC16_008425 [Serendipita sp. 398]KAG8843847.1 hypothetical protein FRC20_003717 [Serendipita sp. 405]